MKRPLIFITVLVLILLSQLPLVRSDVVLAQKDSVFTLVSADGEPIAQVSDYTLTDNQFCFTLTNISSTLTIVGVGPDVGHRTINATGFSQSGPWGLLVVCGTEANWFQHSIHH